MVSHSLPTPVCRHPSVVKRVSPPTPRTRTHGPKPCPLLAGKHILAVGDVKHNDFTPVTCRSG